MNKLKVFVFAVSISSLVAVANAQEAGGGSGSFILSGNFGAYNSKEQTGDTVNRDTQVSSTDAQVGYVFRSGIYVGGIYGNSVMKIKDAATKPEMTHTGGSLGYMTSGGLFLIGHYFSEARIEKVTATADRTKGTGTQVDVGFVKNIGGPIFVGAQVSSRELEYEELDTAGVITESEHKVTELFPAIRLSIIW